MSDVVQSVRQLLQNFVAPELREIKGDVKHLDAKIDSETTRLEDKIASEARQIGADMKRLEAKVDSGFAHLESLLENANLRERVTRLEVERGAQRQ